MNVLMLVSWQKIVLTWLLEVQKISGNHSFPCQSLLLSTTILNDKRFSTEVAKICFHTCY